ncbi:potassium channel family protein [Haloparvum sedimenti]|uniref:potassium channel family protein n=1 Tax=Haloparvum sedimenti TaxID=1678448 RepID=UPI00071E7408|nr:TrkA family potassium uptake protein [Haloparvum sedimenti]
MNVIVVGYGRVGSRVARVLDEEGHDVVVVDNDRMKVERAGERGFRVVEGNGAREATLQEAGVAEADAVGGFTGDPETNHQICLIAGDYATRTVMRVSEDVEAAVYERYSDDVDEVIYPERLGAAGAKTALLGGDFNAIADLTEGLQIFVLTVPEDAPIVGAHVNEIDLGDRGRIYAHGRDRESLTIPLPGTVVEAGDRIALLAATEAVADVRAELTAAEAA